ncbi:MAG: hypothetical protein RLZZ401_1091, partial [Pseudomonadota bacterium]
MTTLSIKDVPEAWASSLRDRAARNHRSLQGELMAIVEAAVREPVAPNPAIQAAADQAAVTQSVMVALDNLAAQRAVAPRRSVIVGYDRRGKPIVRQGWKTVAQVAADLRAQFPEPIVGVDSSVDIIRAER